MQVSDRLLAQPVGWPHWVIFPVILGGAIALALALLPHLGAVGSLVVAETVALVSVAVAEHLLPFRADWNRSHEDVGTDILHALVSGIGTTQLVRPLVSVAAVAAASAVQPSGIGWWPASLPLVAQLALALVLVEFLQYWLHRWQHEVDWLWRFHATHHSAPRLYWLNAARFHPIDIAMLYALGYVPLVFLGCPAEVIMLFALFDAVLGGLQHSNIDVRLGWLNRVFSMAEPHRWHHSRVLNEANNNYGSNLIIWDLVFGTFFLPQDRQRPESIGIGDMPRFPQRYLAQLASPFRWQRVKAEAAGQVREC
jgi:sterol desaturase/sphingolipid hydroxylase (fatty acid hydroxylase superfamily)